MSLIQYYRFTGRGEENTIKGLLVLSQIWSNIREKKSINFFSNQNLWQKQHLKERISFDNISVSAVL